jgi:hypothetical protein
MLMILHLSNALLFMIAWTVQLWVYPKYVRPINNLLYKAVIVVLTLPAMTIQGIYHSLNLFYAPGWIHIIQWLCMLITVALTFAYAVPVHLKMSREGNSESLVKRLLSIHSVRTACWTIILLLDFVKFRI